MTVIALRYEELYATHYQRIYRHVYRLVRHHEQAEDLTQTTFLNAWRVWPPASDANLTGWLYTIATRVALDALARQRRLHFQSLDMLVEWLEETAPVVCEDEACLERLVLTDALGHLPAASCTLLLMSAQGYSATELGRCRGLHKATLARQLASARAELSQHLMEENA
jgi:RNA polymerase sigma-70 factor (ECF subfamily)